MFKNVLLAVKSKKSKPVEIKDPVLDFVQSAYGRQARSDVEDDLDEVQELRDSVISETKTLYDQREALTKYYCILTTMESRFPISKSPGHSQVVFTWNDAFTDRKSDQQVNIHFEKAAVMFNIGAINSQLALSMDRKAENGAKEASKLFQESAGAFVHMRDHACLKIDTPRPVDMTFECATMLEKLMLAQAQECVLEKAIADGKSAALQARLCKQIAVYYDECARILASKPLSEHFEKSWQAHASVKSLIYHLEGDVQNAAALRNEDELKGVANEIARLKSADNVIAQAKKEAKAASKELQESVKAKEDAINQRLVKAERENATVYLQRVPDVADLPSIVPASVVKAIPPANVEPSPEMQKMFSGVVPESSARAMSKYTDMVDKLIRKQTERLDITSDDARIKLREWELPESLHALDPGSTVGLPDAVRVELEAIESQGGLHHLNDVLASVRQLKSVAAESLTAAETDLDTEAREDDELRAHYGSRWNRAPSAQLTKVMRDKIAGYRSNLSAAAESDARLEAKIVNELSTYTLSPDAAARQMPHLQAPMLSVDNMDPLTTVATLRHALEGLNTLSSQRAAIEEALKDRKNSDNILPKLLSIPGDANPDALFAQELRKYDDLIKEVEDNLVKQKQLLEVIDTNQRNFKTAYSFTSWRRSCEDASAALRVQAKTYKEVETNLTEGARFYTSLQDAIGALRQQVADHCMARKVQRDDMLSELKKAADAQEAQAQQQLAAMRLHSGSFNYGQQQQQQQYSQYPPQGGPPPPPPPGAYGAPQHMWPPQIPANYGSNAGYGQQQQPPPQYPPPPPPPQQPNGGGFFGGFGRPQQ